MKYVIACCCVFLFTSCISTMDVQYDEKFDITRYKTYNFYPIIDSNLPEDETKQIMQTIDLQLYKQGYQKSKNPDFYVNFFVEENNSYVPNISEEEKDSEQKTGKEEKIDSNVLRLKTVAIDQLLYLDIIDVKKDQLAWNVVIAGYLEEPITNEKLFDYYVEKIEKVLHKFQETSN